MYINILEYFEQVLLSNRTKTAIIDSEKQYSYLDVDKFSKQVANCLIGQRIDKNQPVAVYLPKSAEVIFSNLGTIMTGNIYMNLDVKSPVDRIKKIIENIEPVFIITNNQLADKIKKCDYPENKILLWEEVLKANINLEKNILKERLSKLIDTDPLCIINTSGSTGTPKGVILNHKSFIDFTEWAIDTLKIGDSEVVGSLSPVIFDIYSFELCMLMAKGSTIVLLPDSLAAYPAKLLEIMKDKKVTFIFWVPTIMVNIANMDLLSKMRLSDLRTVWFAGEVFPTKQFKYWKSHLSEVKFVNLYGPIEITLDCTYYVIERELKDEELIPIGFPCRNTDILILNENNRPATKNEEGELCVRGTSLAMGYYNNFEKTAAAFVQNPLNNSYPEIIYRTGDIVFLNDHGEINFKGRKDTLIKHLGYRIELGEIEHVIINTLKLVENGCVVYNHNKKEITLFYESNKNISIAEMKRAIAEVFPKYMIPTVFCKMDLLPRNPNGKIDRLHLNTKTNNG